MSTKQAQGGQLIKNLAKSARHRERFVEMTRKSFFRLTAVLRREDPAASRQWAADHAVDSEDLLRPLDPAAWEEAERFMKDFDAEADAVLAPIGYDLKRGGDYRLLYFLVRHLRPAVVVETGVAAGYTSSAVLNAMQDNEVGHLWSSDFPYFRLDDPEQYIGILVREELKPRWTLLTKGDRTNLPRILTQCGPIDIFHYDSDKSVEGRRFALKAITPHLGPDAVIVVDDVQDNFHFRDYLAATGRQGHVFEFGGKFVGLIPLGGPLATALG